MDIDLKSVKLPSKMNINYEEHMSREDDNNKPQREVVISIGKQHATAVTS